MEFVTIILERVSHHFTAIILGREMRYQNCRTIGQHLGRFHTAGYILTGVNYLSPTRLTKVDIIPAIARYQKKAYSTDYTKQAAVDVFTKCHSQNNRHRG